MADKKKIQLKGSEQFTHYFIVIYFLIPAFFFIVYFFGEYFDEWNSNFQNPIRFLYISIIHFLLALGVFFFKKKNLVFEEIPLELSDLDFKNALLATAIEMDWEQSKLENHHALFHGNGSWGTMITVLRTEKSIFINSICDPKKRAGFMLKGNKINKKKLRNNFLKVSQNINVLQNVKAKKHQEAINFWNTSEWSLKNMLMRISGYGLTILFFLIGILFIYEGEWFGLIFPIISVSIHKSLTYQYILLNTPCF